MPAMFSDDLGSRASLLRFLPATVLTLIAGNN